uniref:Uncharacterized protein n=1 Tax=Cacopsylla melanoneura TaxID=428564 RepID=A0A8D8XU38_9HEMI
MDSLFSMGGFFKCNKSIQITRSDPIRSILLITNPIIKRLLFVKIISDYLGLPKSSQSRNRVNFAWNSTQNKRRLLSHFTFLCMAHFFKNFTLGRIKNFIFCVCLRNDSSRGLWG